MDKEFLQFWGNFMLTAAKGQEQLENVTQWMQQGFKGFEDLSTLFRNAYGLKDEPQISSDYLDNWKKAQENFAQSFRDFCSTFGFVPKDEHLELVRKYEELKQKVNSQEETIKHLRLLLAEAGSAERHAVDDKLNDLVEKQTEQFQKLMEGFGQMFNKDQTSD